MIIRVSGEDVQVADESCSAQLPCFYLFADKGTFVTGRGYTSYYNKTTWCCGTNHLHGCPVAGACDECGKRVAPYHRTRSCRDRKCPGSVTWCLPYKLRCK